MGSFVHYTQSSSSSYYISISKPVQ